MDTQKRQDESGRTLEGQFLYSVGRSEPQAKNWTLSFLH